MVFRIFFVLFFFSFFSSCQYFSSEEKGTITPSETIDFSTVDVSPSFKNCESLLDEAKTNCFRKTLQEIFTRKLEKHSFITKNNINEFVDVVLHIDKEGVISIKEIKSSNEIKEELPKLEDELQLIVSEISKLLPATKRGIPVAVEYNLPIQIKTSM